MNNISIKDIETTRLYINKPTMKEQYDLWNIVRLEEVNRYYFPTPNRIFKKHELSVNNINDIKAARKIFMEQLNDWSRQEPFYESKIESINKEDNKQKFTWSIFLKSGEVIGQITVQPSDESEDQSIRDIGWFINPIHQGNGYATEAASCILDFMFKEVEINRIITSSAIVNTASWKLMEKLGFKRIGEKDSTYFDESGNILKCYCYEITKEDYLNKE